MPALTASLHTRPDSLGHRLSIHCSGGEYEYRNVIIDNTLSIENSEYTVNFTGTSCDGDCIESGYDGDGSADGNVTFPQIPNGQYSFAVEMNGSREEGTLYASDLSYSISLPSSQDFSFSQCCATVGRTPPTALLAAIIDVNDDQARIDLINHIQDAGQCSDLALPVGRYEFFDIGENGEAEIYDQPSYTDTTLVYTYNGNKELLIEAFTTWKSSHPNEIYSKVRFMDGMHRFFIAY